MSPAEPSADDPGPRIFTVVGLLLPCEGVFLRGFSHVGWSEAANAVQSSYLPGELQLLGAVSGQLSLVGLARDLPLGPPVWKSSAEPALRWFTVFGFDWSSHEAIAQSIGARHWVSAAHTLIRTQPKSFQLAGVAEGAHSWLAGTSWHDHPAKD